LFETAKYSQLPCADRTKTEAIKWML
jgi:hypothetical protein